MGYDLNPQEPPEEPRVQVHKAHYITPAGQEKAATLNVMANRLVIVITGEAEALAHYPVIRGTPNARVTPDLVDDHKQREAQFFLFAVDQILAWAEHVTLPFDSITSVAFGEDESGVPTMRVESGGEVHHFRFRLTSARRLGELQDALAAVG